jgi:hypothetical protein
MSIAMAGGTCFFDDSVVETAQTVVAGPVMLFNLLGYNSGGAVSYLQFFDALLVDVIVGTTAPKFSIPLPATGGYSDTYQLPEGFRTGIVIACTAGPLNNTAPGAGALVKLTYAGGS